MNIIGKKGTDVLLTDNYTKSEAIFARQTPAKIVGARKVKPTEKNLDKRVELVLDVIYG